MENTPGKENFTYENYTYGKLYLWRIHREKKILLKKIILMKNCTYGGYTGQKKFEHQHFLGEF